MQLGLSDEEFWRLSPVQFHLLLKQRRDNIYQEDYRSALITAMVANTARDPKKQKRPFKPEDFLGQRPRTRVQSWEEQLDIVTMLNTAMGGEDRRKKGTNA